MTDVENCPPEIVDELERLTRLSATDVNHLQNAPSFFRFVQACQTHYPSIRSGSALRFSLALALRRLGLACLVGGNTPELAASAPEIAKGLDKAIRSNESRRLHLCPLDLASELPPISFGPNQVQRFSATELEQLFDALALQRANQSWSLDSGRFSQFNWLVVSDVVQHDDMGPDGRKLPGLFANLTQDFGRIEPYSTGIPAAVASALFGLLTVPWEEIAGYKEMEWRGFRVPWVYTVNADIFARQLPPPTADSLSWEPAWHRDADGEREYERPIGYPLSPDSDPKIQLLDDQAWENILSARKTALFERPVAHFFVHGFQTDGIDEFLAHISTIEAALGSPIDHDARKRSKLTGKGQGATRRVCLRISALLNDASAGAAYGMLFGIRSDFLHGKLIGDVSSVERRSARELARKVVCALIGAAVSSRGVNRDKFLANLLDVGAQIDLRLSPAPQLNGDRSG